MLDAKLIVMELQRENDNWGFLPYRETWGKVELKSSRNIFSSVAMSAKTIEIILRKQDLTLQHSFLWGDKQLFITQIDDTKDRHFLKIIATEIKPVMVTRKIVRHGKNELNNPVRLPPELQSFPAWITEKYVKLTKERPFYEIEASYVLIVPKPIDAISVGDIIKINGESFAVEATHLLDPDKNEYEVVFRRNA